MRPTPQAQQVNRLKIVVASLPTGAKLGLTKEQVASLLQKEGVESVYQRVDESFIGGSDVTDFGYTKADLSGYTKADLSGYTKADLSGYTVAYVRGTPRSLIGGCSVYFNFYFDPQGKLIRIAEQTRCIGL